MKDLDTLGGDKRFLALLWEIAELHSKKQEDYGFEGTTAQKPDPFANVRASSEFGVKPWVGAFVRLNDKVTRLKSFARKGVLQNESAEDSMKDIAVYSLIALILYREESAPPDLAEQCLRVEDARATFGIPATDFGCDGNCACGRQLFDSHVENKP